MTVVYDPYLLITIFLDHVYNIFLNQHKISNRMVGHLTYFWKIAMSALLGRHYGFLTMNQIGKVDFFEPSHIGLSKSEVKPSVHLRSYGT